MMSGSKSDVMMFALKVTRPEHAIDAPTEVRIKEVLVGTYPFIIFYDNYCAYVCMYKKIDINRYSNAAFQEAMKYALSKAPAASNVHGGFSEQNQEDVGFFKGPDGKYMNACLPLCIYTHIYTYT